MTAPEEGRANLARQRRFLLVMCVIVVAYYALGARVRPEVEYSGFLVSVERPELTAFGLWAIWTWALIGYSQRLYKLFEIARDAILRDVRAEDQRLALRAAQRHAIGEAKAGRIGENYSDVVVSRQSIAMMPQLDQARDATGQVVVVNLPDFQRTASDGRVYRHLRGSFRGISKETGGQGTSSFNFSMEWGPWRTRWLACQAWARAVAFRPAISDHFGPLLIAALTVGSPFYPWPADHLEQGGGLAGQRFERTR